MNFIWPSTTVVDLFSLFEQIKTLTSFLVICQLPNKFKISFNAPYSGVLKRFLQKSLFRKFSRNFFRRIEKIEFFRLSFCNLKNNRALLRSSANFSAINIVRETQQAFTGRSIAPNMTQIWQTPII